jgi:hypothetical protein
MVRLRWRPPSCGGGLKAGISSCVFVANCCKLPQNCDLRRFCRPRFSLATTCLKKKNSWWAPGTQQSKGPKVPLQLVYCVLIDLYTYILSFIMWLSYPSSHSLTSFILLTNPLRLAPFILLSIHNSSFS